MPPAPRSRSTANALVAAGLVAFGLTAAAYPVYAARSIQLDAEGSSLSSAAIRRGAYNNSGSKDVGRS